MTDQKTAAELRAANIAPAYPLEVCNMVITAESDMCCDMRAVAVALNGRYGPNVFPSVTVRHLNPFITVALFSSGGLLITGTTNYTETLMVIYMTVDRLWESLGVAVNIYNLRLRNVVGSLALGYGLDLDAFSFFNPDDTEFDPETFPGLRWEPGKSKTGLMSKKQRKKHVHFTVIMYTTGAVVGTGAHTKEQLQECFAKIMHIFPQYRAGQTKFIVPPLQSKYRKHIKRKLTPKEKKEQKKKLKLDAQRSSS